MATAELLFQLKGDPSNVKRVLAEVRQDFAQTTKAQTADAKREASAAQALQKQRSAALFTIWKADTRAREREEKQRTRDADREERVRMQAVLSLQKQRSAALIAAWKAEQREQVRIAREAAQEAARATDRARTTRGAFLAGAVGGVTALIGVSAVSEIRAAASAWVDYSSKLETTKIAFTTMLGSAQAAEEHLKELQTFALKTPFQFSELIDASQRMQALGFQAAQIVPILTDVGNAVAAAGGGSERLDRVVLAISQIQSKGKVATQELNQLAEAGIGGFKILEAQLGKSRAELIKMVEAGEISSAVFLDAFQKFSQQNFGGLMEAQSRTFTGAMSNIKDALLQTSATAFAPLFQRLSETARHFSEASQKSDEFKQKLEVVGNFASTVWDGGAEAIRVLRDAYRLALTALFAQFEVLEGVLVGAVHQFRSLYFAALAFVRLIKGDFTGALEASNRSQREQTQVINSAIKAIEAEGKILKEIIRIYNDAAAAARRLKDERAGITTSIDLGPEKFQRQVGADVQGFGAGILRKKGPGTPTEEGDADKARKEAQARATRALQLQFQILEEATRKNREKLERERDLDIKSIDDWENESRVAHTRHLESQNELFNQEEANIRRYVTDVQDRHLALIELGIKRQKALDDMLAAVQKIEDDAQKKREARALRTQKELVAIRDAQRQGELDVIRRALDNQEITESRAIDKQLEILAKAHKDRIDLIDAEIAHKSTTTEQDISLLNERAKADQEYTNEVKRLSAERKRAREEEELLRLSPRPAPELEIPGGQILSDEAIDALGKVPEQFSIWQEAMRELHREMVNFDAFIKGTFIFSLKAIGDALAQGVIAWALYGQSFGKAMKQALAAVLAKIAAEATYQAAIHAAYAIGSLAFGDFAGAAKHALAAAKFAAVAVATGLGARAISGASAFGGGSNTHAGGGGGGGGTTAAQKPVPVERDRRVNEPTAVQINLNIRRDPGSIVDVVVEDHRDNGRIRQMLLQEANG